MYGIGPSLEGLSSETGQGELYMPALTYLLEKEARISNDMIQFIFIENIGILYFFCCVCGELNGIRKLGSEGFTVLLGG